MDAATVAAVDGSVKPSAKHRQGAAGRREQRMLCGRAPKVLQAVSPAEHRLFSRRRTSARPPRTSPATGRPPCTPQALAPPPISISKGGEAACEWCVEQCTRCAGREAESSAAHTAHRGPEHVDTGGVDDLRLALEQLIQHLQHHLRHRRLAKLRRPVRAQLPSPPHRHREGLFCTTLRYIR